MANKLLLRTLAKFSDQIKSGTAKVQDIITDYFNTTGKSVTEEERAIILNEFAKDAPSNVTTLEGVDAVETIMPMGGKPKMTGDENLDFDFVETPEGYVKVPGSEGAFYRFGEKNKDLIDKGVKNIRGKINYPKMEEQLGVKLRGNETFDELLEIEKNTRESQQGIGSLFPKGRGAIFEKIDDRDDVADFIKKMRKEGIANKDIKGVFKEFGTDIEGGKRAATTLARAADMKADTKIKQELLSELDEMKFDRGPRFFQEEYMGYDNFRTAVENTKARVNNAIADDLELMGVSDEVVTSIMGRARETANKPYYTSGEDFIDIIKDELEFNDITNYDLEFYKKYFRELESLMRKPKPRFAYGGMI